MALENEAMNVALRSLVILSIFLAVCVPVCAAPSVSGVSGAMSPGEGIAISGGGFGNKPIAAPLKWDDFENGTVGATLQSVDPTWVPYYYGSAIYNNATSHSGVLAAYNDPFSMTGFSTNYFQFAPTDEVFVAYWINMTHADVTDYAVIKLSRINSSSAAAGGGVYNGTGDSGFSNICPRYGTSGYLHYSPGGGLPAVNLGYASVQYDTWLRVDMYKKVSTPGVADGACDVAAVGIGSQTHHDIMTRAAGETFLQDTVLLGLMAANCEGQFELQIDDVYIDNTRARVEIGNASTWSGCTHREVQIPTSWSSGSITATVNQGSFADGASAYLYVVDAEGAASASGYPITIGQVSHSLTVTNGNGSGEYDEGEVVAISADPAPSGKLFAWWIGGIAHISDRMQPATTVTMPAEDVSVTATYAWGYQLTVNNGTGDGLYLYGTVVDIQADAAPTNMAFDEWTGDTGQIAEPHFPATTLTMPSKDCEVTAMYVSAVEGDLDASGFVGQADLDIILANWGDSPPADPRADPSGDNMVGQSDLDIVLYHWGERAQP